MQVLWLDVLESHEAVNACGGRIRDAVCVEVDEVSEAGEIHGRVSLQLLFVRIFLPIIFIGQIYIKNFCQPIAHHL